MPRFKYRRAAVSALAVALLMPTAASAEVNGCPGKFAIGPAPAESSTFWADRNGDGLQCNRVFPTPPARIHIITIDNNVRSNPAPGLADDGSTVLVDTDTGDVISP